MIEVLLTYPTPEGSREIRIEGERTSFGRGSDADHRFADDGLSRLHATVYRDGERVWIVDENSSNGTFVNGQKTAPAGTPLRNGDQVKIGHQTIFTVRISEKAAQAIPTAAASTSATRSVSSEPSSVSILPIALIACALLIFSVSAVFIGFKVLGGGQTEVAENNDDSDPTPTRPDKDPKESPTPKVESTETKTANSGDNTIIATPTQTTVQQGYKIPAGKTYFDLSDGERRQYLSDRAMKIAQIIGNNSSEAIPPQALDKIKGFTEGFASRRNAKGMNGCPSRRPWGDNLQATYDRASKNAPFINKAFNEKGIDPRIGLYLAMIESEHCVCLQSSTGPLGMFQFTKATGEIHGLRTVRGATPENPDERCEPEPAARAAASYMKALTGRYGTGPSSVPLAIGSYNSGEGGLSSNLVKALESNTGLPRDFWTLIANGEKLSKQFQSENFKYVPKFFAAAIIGEYPQDFGLKLQPLSTYSK